MARAQSSKNGKNRGLNEWLDAWINASIEIRKPKKIWK